MLHRRLDVPARAATVSSLLRLFLGRIALAARDMCACVERVLQRKAAKERAQRAQKATETRKSQRRFYLTRLFYTIVTLFNTPRMPALYCTLYAY